MSDEAESKTMPSGCPECPDFPEGATTKLCLLHAEKMKRAMVEKCGLSRAEIDAHIAATRSALARSRAKIAAMAEEIERTHPPQQDRTKKQGVNQWSSTKYPNSGQCKECGC